MNVYDGQQQQQPPHELSSLQIAKMNKDSDYDERLRTEALKECFADSFSMISVDLDLEEDASAAAAGADGGCFLKGGGTGISSSSAAALENARLRREVTSLQARLRRSEEEKDAHRRERSAQKRELTNLRKCLKANQAVAELRKRVAYLEVEKDYFVREIHMLEDKVEELEGVNEAKTCQLDVFDKLFRMMGEDNNDGNGGGGLGLDILGSGNGNGNGHSAVHPDEKGPPDTITLSTCPAEEDQSIETDPSSASSSSVRLGEAEC